MLPHEIQDAINLALAAVKCDDTRLTGYVYVIRAGESFYKIGVASDVQRRLVDLQNACPLSLEVVHVLAHSHPYRLEGCIHELLYHRKHHREWFKFEGDAEIPKEKDGSENYDWLFKLLLWAIFEGAEIERVRRIIRIKEKMDEAKERGIANGRKSLDLPTELIEQAQALYNDGHTVKCISKHLNVSESSLRRKAGLGKQLSESGEPIKRPRGKSGGRKSLMNVSQVMEAVALLDKDTMQGVARHIGVHVSTLRRQLARYGFRLPQLEATKRGIAVARNQGKAFGRHPALTAEQLEQARELLKTYPLAEVANALHVSESTIRRRAMKG